MQRITGLDTMNLDMKGWETAAIDDEAIALLNQITERFELEVLRTAWDHAERNGGSVTDAMLWDAANVVFESDASGILGPAPPASPNDWTR